MKRFLKWTGITATIPVILFFILCILIYLPPIQNFLVKKSTQIASETSGLNIQLKRLSLSFPLDIVVHDATVVEKEDTLLHVERLKVDIQLLPLIHQQVEIDGITLQGASVNSKSLIDGIKLNGNIGRLYITSHGVHFSREKAVINQLDLSDADIAVQLTDAAEPDTTVSEPIAWKVVLDEINMDRIRMAVDLPSDSLKAVMAFREARLKGGVIGLDSAAYSVDHFHIHDGEVIYRSGAPELAENVFNADHVHLRNLYLDTDSLYYQNNDIRANIRRLECKERSGLQVVKGVGQLRADNDEIRIPEFKIKTSASSFYLTAAAGWEILRADGARLNLKAQIGKDDLLRFISDVDPQLANALPDQPLELKAHLDGNINNIRLTELNAQMPDVLDMRMEGQLRHLTDSARRKGELNLYANFINMDFIRTLSNGITIPTGTSIEGHAHIEGNHIESSLALSERGGKAELKTQYNMAREAYRALISIDRLNLNDFMPNDSLYDLCCSLKADGEGFDFFAPTTRLQAEGGLSHFQYGSQVFSGIGLTASQKDNQFQLKLSVKDNAVDLNGHIEAMLQPQGIKAHIDLMARRLHLKGLQLTESDITTRFHFKADATTDMQQAHKVHLKVGDIHFKSPETSFKTKDLRAGAMVSNDSVISYANAGDLTFGFRAYKNIDELTQSIDAIGTLLAQQWQQKVIDQEAIKQVLPTAEFHIVAGNDNPLANILGAQDISFRRIRAELNTSPQKGLRAKAHIHRLQSGTTRLDTIFFNTVQLDSSLVVSSGVIANRTTEQEAFNINVNSTITPRQAQLLLTYLDGEKRLGTHLGLNALLRDNGFSLHVDTTKSIIAFKPITVNPNNYIYIKDNGRILADLKMRDGKTMSAEFYSSPDSTAEQNLSLALAGINIGELKTVVPYMPDLSGIVNAEAHYIQAAHLPNLSADVEVQELAYQKEALGNWQLSTVYLPTEDGTHYADGYLSRNGEEIADINGRYTPEGLKSATDEIKARLMLYRFPLDIANAFFPDHSIATQGVIDGNMDISGSSSNPVVNGKINMNNITVSLSQISQTLRLEDKSLQIKNNHLDFNRVKIFTGGKTPFTIDGEMDLMQMNMDLRMLANNFELINAKRTKESIAYGKLVVNLDSRIKGDISDLKVNGNLTILGNSDFTYIMQESPLTVEDRLGATVTFVNFSDTTSIKRRQLPTISLEGIDMLFNMHIDEGVQCMIDLNDGSNNYMKFEGGGDLAFQYKPDGTMFLNGRYTLLSGEMKYAISLISKTFKIRRGSFIEWTGNVMNPNMNIKAMERVRAAVAQDENNTRNVNFDVGVEITNRLNDMGFTFTLEAPEDGTMQNELASKSATEKNKMAITMLVTGMYVSDTGAKGGGMNTNSALNSLLQSEINKLAGSAIRTVDINVGMETSSNGEDGSSRTDYNFQLSKRFWNNRIRVIIGGKISTGNDASNTDESFIDNVSLEYRLDNSGTRYVKLFHEKNFESILDGEVTETGAGIVLRKKVSRLGELFIFRKKKKQDDLNQKTSKQKGKKRDNKTATSTTATL